VLSSKIHALLVKNAPKVIVLIVAPEEMVGAVTVALGVMAAAVAAVTAVIVDHAVTVRHVTVAAKVAIPTSCLHSWRKTKFVLL
jgi:hypothetical protein